jgi:hypothetical protein
MPIDPEEFREVLRELVAQGSIIEHDGRFYARGFEPEEARKTRDGEEPFELIAGPLDGARIGLTPNCTHAVFFIGVSWVIYVRFGDGRRMMHIGNCETEEQVDRLIEDDE